MYKLLNSCLLDIIFFSNSVINQWNSLPGTVVNAPMVAVFKQKLDNSGTNQDMGTSKAGGLA